MLLTCPCCAARYCIEAGLADESARVAVAAALKMPPPLGDLTLRYLGLFRPHKHALSWDRAARLLTELQAAIAVGQVTRHGRAWAAPLAAWQHALEQVIEARERLTLPLKSHGYLYEIVAGAAQKAQGVAEQKTEELKRRPAYRDTASAPAKSVKSVAGIARGLEQLKKATQT